MNWIRVAQPGTRDLAGVGFGTKFVVSRAGEAYDVRARGPNRKSRVTAQLQIAFPANPLYRLVGLLTMPEAGGSRNLPSPHRAQAFAAVFGTRNIGDCGGRGALPGRYRHCLEWLSGGALDGTSGRTVRSRVKRANCGLKPREPPHMPIRSVCITLRPWLKWLKAEAHGDKKLAALFEGRFLPEFRPAFEAWKKTDPVNNPNAPAGPQLMEEYRSSKTQEAAKLNDASNRDAGNRAAIDCDQPAFQDSWCADWTAGDRHAPAVLSGLPYPYAAPIVDRQDSQCLGERLTLAEWILKHCFQIL
jgi:hypothetical protein